MKKQYLQIEISGRGEIDKVEVIESDDIKSYVEKRFNEFVEDGESEEGWDEYVEEFGSVKKNDWGWFIGLGEEDYWFVVDMESDLYVKFKNKLEYGEDWSLNELIDELDY